MNARFLWEASRWARDNNLPQSAHYLCIRDEISLLYTGYLSECEMWISFWVALIYDREKVMSNWRGMLEIMIRIVWRVYNDPPNEWTLIIRSNVDGRCFDIQ